MAVIPFPRRNTLAYPAGSTPGFDPSHPAAATITGSQGLSAIATNGNFINLLTAKAGTRAGAPASAMLAIGPSLNFGAGSDGVLFSGNSTAAYLVTTLAAIVQFDNALTGSYQGILENGTSGAFSLLTLNGSGVVVVYRGADMSSGFSPASNTPYFIVASVNASTANFVIVNLKNGSVFNSSTTGSASLGATDGTYQIGNNSNQPTTGKIAAAMYAPSYMSMPQLLAWAKDPWSFWYPRQAQMRIAVAAGGFLAAWARNSNLPVLGTGTY